MKFFSSDTNGGAVIPLARGPMVSNSGQKQRLDPFLEPNETYTAQMIADLVRLSRPQTVKWVFTRLLCLR